jgi:transposase
MTKQWTRLTDSQWNEVKPYLPIGRKRKYDLRDIVDAILWMVRTGARWRNLPDQFPPYRSVFYYFNKWSKNKTIESINDGLNRLERKIVHDRGETPRYPFKTQWV